MSAHSSASSTSSPLKGYFAVWAAQTARRTLLIGSLILTMLLGTVFLGIKGIEYREKFVEHHVPGASFSFEKEPIPGHPGEYANPRHAQIFFSLYFVMTGLHALHMIIGLGIFLWLLVMAWKGRFTPQWHTPVEIGGLYWHFVDIIWIYLFPLLYLIDRHP
jgi:cytochrome c oxidase subunit 3